MNADLTLVTTVAVLVHLSTSVAAMVLKNTTDRDRVSLIDAKVDQVLSLVAAVPMKAPKTVNDIAADLANVASALAAATAPTAAAPLAAAPVNTTLMGAALPLGGNANAG